MDLLSDSLSATSSRGQQQPLPRTTDTSRGFARSSGELTENNPADSRKLDNLDFELQQKKMELSRLEADYNDLLQTHHATIKENHNLKAWTTQLEKDLGATRQKKSSIEHELQACKDDLFRLQPTAQIPDSDIAQSYDDLNEQISSWMEGVIARFEAKYRERHHGPLPNLFHHGDVTAAADFLADHPMFGGEYLVRCYLQILLQRMVFADNILLHGLNESQTALFRSIEQSMAKSKPPRDTGSIRTWLSEALCALTTTADYQQSSRKVNGDIVTQVFDEVARFFPIVKKEQEGLIILWETVVRPAVTLAKKIQTSPTYYEFLPKIGSLSQFRYCDVHRAELPNYKLIDIASRKTLKVNSPVRPNEKGHIGTQIMVLAPALYRRDPGQAPLLLVKEIDLVELHTPLGRRQTATAREEDANKSSLI
ncbi:MAG: hypothetical protein L6R38_007670 [Xanthoria sp. 2 TBL-2021]|nr:MAG: hypothetical protein L6R38_007670 [Xanthoria sp. 2 TBL-2021]